MSTVTRFGSDGEMYFRLEIGKTAWWSCFIHLADVILAFLLQFREADRNGVPGDFVQDPTGDCIPDSDGWEASIAKMINAFQLIKLDNDDLPSKKVMEQREQEIEDGMLEFAQHFRSLWD